MQIGELYAEGRERIVGVVGGLSPEQAAARVPTYPEWSDADVLAHLTGICADVLAGNTDGVATNPWTAAQERYLFAFEYGPFTTSNTDIVE